jgi:hypothetical protein
VLRAEGRLEVRLHWRGLARMTRPYSCFIHVLGQNGAVIGQLDHLIAAGHPSTEAWETGDDAYEYLVFASRKQATSLRLGVFDPQSGDRLRVGQTDFTRTDTGTAIVVSSHGQK